MEFFTADDHFYHKNVIKYCNRPFADLKEMHETLIENWNKKVKGKNDTVYIIGDFSFYKTGPILEKLNGKKILIAGDHDKDAWKESYRDQWEQIIPYGVNISPHGKSITLTHWCQRVWKKSHYNSWHLFGHSHGKLEPIGKSWDVGVDANNFEPISFDEIAAIMKKRPDNFNLVRSRKG